MSLREMTSRDARSPRYCQLLCPETIGLGGVLEDSISKKLAFNEVDDQFMAVQTMPAFLCRLGEFEHHGETGLSRPVSLGAAMSQTDCRERALDGVGRA